MLALFRQGHTLDYVNGEVLLCGGGDGHGGGEGLRSCLKLQVQGDNQQNPTVHIIVYCLTICDKYISF